jgi:hypothetical protein
MGEIVLVVAGVVRVNAMLTAPSISDASSSDNSRLWHDFSKVARTPKVDFVTGP